MIHFLFSFAVFRDDIPLLRRHLIKIFQIRRDDSASVYSYLSSNIDYLPQDIVSLNPLRTDDDPFNTAYMETKLDENVFGEEFYFKRLFIQGEAGCGKSTFIQKIISDWIHSHEKAETHGLATLNSYELVLARFLLMIPIALGKVNNERHIEDILMKHVFGKGCPLHAQDTMNILAENQAHVLFLLDGYDEYSDASTAIEELLDETILPNVTIILTSRKWKLQLPKITESCDKLIEIKGLSDENAKRFVSKFMLSKEINASDAQTIVAELWKCLELAEYKFYRNNPMLLLFACIVWLETSSLSSKSADLYRKMIKCLFDMYERENSEVSSHRKSRKGVSEDESKPKPTFQSFLVNSGKIAFRCLLARKQCLMRVPSHWFDQEMYHNYLVLALEIGLLQEHKIIQKQNERSVAAFSHKSLEEFLAAYYLCNVNDPSIIFHEQAAIIELLNAGKIEKAFVYKFLDILTHVSGINPVIACELLSVLIPEMESDFIVMEKLRSCAEEMVSVEGLNLPLRRLRFDRYISDNLIKLCVGSLEYLSFVNCEKTEECESKTSPKTENTKSHIHQSLFTSKENMQNLTFLNLDHVNLSNLSLSEQFLPKLNELAVRAIKPAGKGLVDVVTKIKSPALKEVTIDYCDFKNEVISFPKLSSINTLTLANLKLCPPGWTSLLQSLENLPALCHLMLSSSNILGESTSFPKLKRLNKLELNTLEFESDHCCKEFVESMRNLGNLELIEITATSVTKHIVNLDALPALKRMTLNDIIFKSEICFTGANANLGVLELNRLVFLDHCGQKFISSISNLPNLTNLKISYCNFENENINFLKLKSLKNISLVKNSMNPSCWCVSIFSLGQLEDLEILVVVYAEDEATNVIALIEDMVDQRSPVPKIVSFTKTGHTKSVTVDFTSKESLMHTGSCCMQ